MITRNACRNDPGFVKTSETDVAKQERHRTGLRKVGACKNREPQVRGLQAERGGFEPPIPTEISITV